MRQLPLGIRLPDRAVFASFLPGRNVQAVAHVSTIAHGETSGTTWLCGPPGSGKTHLLQAVCVKASEAQRAGFFPLSELASLGVGMLEGLPELDCLCVDDLDHVVGKSDWERALFGVFHAIDERGASPISARGSPQAPSFSSARSRKRNSRRPCSSMRRPVASSFPTKRRAGCNAAIPATCTPCTTCSTRSTRRRSSLNVV
jgi:chromosomal replication initiation ATPase DnaA